MNVIGQIVGGLFGPVADIFKAREARKQAKEQAEAKLKVAKQEGWEKLQLADQEWEQLAVQATKDSWKDEYVTLSVVSVFNLLVVGGLAAAFGEPRVLEGLSIAIQALTAAGVDVGFIMEAVVLAAIGLSIWRKV
jgi:hypothetical protein